MCGIYRYNSTPIADNFLIQLVNRLYHLFINHLIYKQLSILGNFGTQSVLTLSEQSNKTNI